MLGVPCSFTVTLGCGACMRADQAATLARTHPWSNRSAGAGSKGEHDYAWAWIATTNEHHHLLVRRNLKDPTDLAYFYRYSPPGPAASHLGHPGTGSRDALARRGGVPHG